MAMIAMDPAFAVTAMPAGAMVSAISADTYVSATDAIRSDVRVTP